MYIGISNWRNWSFDPSNMKFFTLFQFLTRFLTSKYLKLFSTYLVGRNRAMLKTCFSARQNAKKQISWNIKTKFITDFLLKLCLREWRIILVITRWALNSQTFTLISNTITRIWKFLFTRNRVCKHKEVGSKLFLY